MESITGNIHFILAGAIVVAALFVVGIKDLSRLSLKRIRAIASVNFTESIRRRVLLITPLAMLGVIIVSQLQKPVDEADAVRQTIKFCLFATGTVVTIVTIILACTNLPKEIENRVIYTVVTKPTTRLEIIFGKIAGFAAVSAVILLIMGLFTWGYLGFRAWNLRQSIAERLERNEVPAMSRPTLEHYREVGLLSAKSYAWPQDMQVYAKEPTITDSRRWVYGKSEQDILVPFAVNPDDLVPKGAESAEQGPGAAIVLHLDYRQRNLTTQEIKEAGGPVIDIEPGAPTSGFGPLAPEPTTGPARPATNAPPPFVGIAILNDDRNFILGADKVNNWPQSIRVPVDPNQPIQLIVPPQQIALLQKAGRFYVQITPVSAYTVYGMNVTQDRNHSPAVIVVPGMRPEDTNYIYPALKPGEKSGIASPIFRGRDGSYGQQLRGGPSDRSPVGVYSFRGSPLNPDASGNVAFEFKSGIERGGDDQNEESDDLTDLQVSVADPDGKPLTTQPFKLTPETGRTVYFTMPASNLAGGNFDVLIRNGTTGHWVGLKSDSIVMVVDNDSFAYNLLKSLLILWLMSVLVIAVSVFCSTFVSWPIAVVLTLVILLGRWGVEQIGDATESGIGNRVAQDIFGTQQAAQAKVVSKTVEALSKYLNVVASILPDISRFQASEDVERGITIPHARLRDAIYVAGGFGIPIALLAYIFLKYKEVAP